MSPYELFKKEKTLVQQAAQSEQGEIILRKHIYPLIESISLYYSAHYNVPYKELIPIGWTHFEYALINYRKRLRKMNVRNFPRREMYSFGLYFVWYIQQSIETYLGISKRPLIGIVPKKSSHK